MPPDPAPGSYAWTWPGGGQLAVGRVSTAATVGRLLTNQWQSIPFSDPFPATPVVLSHDDPQEWVPAKGRLAPTEGGWPFVPRPPAHGPSWSKGDQMAPEEE